MSERRNLEYVTKTGRGTIHTRPATDEYRDGWERTFGGNRRPAEAKPSKQDPRQVED